MQKDLTCAQTRGALEALFIGDALPQPLRVRQHLRACSGCRAWFEDLAQSELALMEHPEEEDLPPDCFQRRYSQALLEAAAAPQGSSLWERCKGWWSAARPSPALLGALGALALVAASGLAWLSWEPAPDFTPRSAQPTAPLAQATAGIWQLELFCVRRQAPDQRPGFLARDTESGELRCQATDELKVTYLNHTSQGAPMGYLALYSLDEQGALRWHLPSSPVSPQSVSMAIEGNQRIAPLGETLRLDQRHTPGHWEMRAIFSRAPLPRQALEEHLRRHSTPQGASWVGEDGQREHLEAEGQDYLLRTARFQIVEEQP